MVEDLQGLLGLKRESGLAFPRRFSGRYVDAERLVEAILQELEGPIHWKKPLILEEHREILEEQMLELEEDQRTRSRQAYP